MAAPFIQQIAPCPRPPRRFGAPRPPRLDEPSLAAVRRLGDLMESADRYTFGHCARVANLAVAVARVLGLGDARLTAVRLGAYLHDLGKVFVPASILNKPGRLKPAEMALVRQHPGLGVDLLAAVGLPSDLAPMVRWHHERRDGTGYPDGLRGDEIPLEAQIISIVDSYDALTTARSYHPATSPEQALEVLRHSRHWWHPDVYAGFLASHARSHHGGTTPWRRRIATVESIGSA
jgi:putative nucleotidyltransferase with HDIG domain